MAHGHDEKVRSCPRLLEGCSCLVNHGNCHGNKADSLVTYQKYFIKAAQLTFALRSSEEEQCGI
jgi:hypothetical protein